MTFYADLHVHSKYSRATSRNCDLENLAIWARKKGIGIVATGDFTHPAWRAELKEKLVPAEPGLFRLRPDLETFVEERLPAACRSRRTAVRFMLSVEISTIYKKFDRTRKIHHLIYTPDFESTDRVVDSLSRIGNLHSDGRPILGLDSRHLLEIALESGPGSYLVPAHIWTPWFAALGSKSGFDAIDECYGDLASHIFAVETGLSSDPPMNWRVSSLDRFRLVSNSDAHSPEKLGREVCVFDTELDYFALRRALETGEGYEGTLEFFPEEGKYHLDGHRNCNVRLSPGETRARGGLCPACGKPLTVGVMHRVEDLADRPEDTAPPETAGSMQSLIPLPEILSEIHQVGPKSKRVARAYESLLGQLGPELQLLNALPLEEIAPASSSLVTEAVSRLRRQEVIRQAGYDGVYGTIRLFEDAELRRYTRGAPLFREESGVCAPSSAERERRLSIGEPRTSAPPGRVEEIAPAPDGGSALSRTVTDDSRGKGPESSEASSSSVRVPPARRPPPNRALPNDRATGLLGRTRCRSAPGGRDRPRPAARRGRPGVRKDPDPDPSHRPPGHASRRPCLLLPRHHLHSKGCRRDARPPAGAAARRVGAGPDPYVPFPGPLHSDRASQRRRSPARLSGRVGGRADSIAAGHAGYPGTKGAQPVVGHFAREADSRVAVGRRSQRGAGGIRVRHGGPQPVRLRRPRHPGRGRAGRRACTACAVPPALAVGFDRRVPGRRRASRCIS